MNIEKLKENMENSNIRLTQLKNKDQEDYFNLISDKDIVDYYIGLYVDNEKDYQELLLDPNSKIYGVYGKKFNDELIGVISLQNCFYENMCELSFFVGKKFRSKGIGNEVAELLIKDLKECDINRVILATPESNIPATKIINNKMNVSEKHKYEDDYEEEEIIYVVEL